MLSVAGMNGSIEVVGEGNLVLRWMLQRAIREWKGDRKGTAFAQAATFRAHSTTMEFYKLADECQT